MKSQESNNILPIVAMMAAAFFGWQMLQQYQNEVYPTAVQVGGFSIASILAALTGGLALIKKFMPNTGSNYKVVQIIQLIIELLEENVAWEEIKKKLKASGLPSYISIKFAWGDEKKVYPIEIGIPPTVEEEIL